MADKLCIFAGTTEGRALAKLLCRATSVTVCVATEYGEVLLDGIEGISVHTGRMDAQQIQAFLKASRFSRVIDATHPYAQAVTENIASAANAAGIPLLRILRSEDLHDANAVYVQTVAEAAAYLAEKDGNILITTGAKELSAYAQLNPARIWARVLPSAASLAACEHAGIPTAHIIAAQGPFSEEMNLAQLNMIGASWLVTKASGKNGGFAEKLSAAHRAGAVPVVIGQPPQTEGVSFSEAVRMLSAHYPLPNRSIALVGIGVGDAALLTGEAKAAIAQSDAVFGAKSVTETLHTQKPCFAEFTPEKVCAVLDAHPEIRRAAVLLRGDTGFYSGAKKLIQAFSGEDVTVLCGVSSVSAFAAKLGVSWDDAALLSAHGREENIVHAVLKNKKCFILTGGENTPPVLLQKLQTYGFGDCFCAVGEKLSYAEEAITKGTVSALCGKEYDALSLLYVENEHPNTDAYFGIADAEFLRGDVPMTKSEVRAVSLSKLKLQTNSIVWDVGAGTGSVSVECALAAPKGTVYAIEKEAPALELIAQNRRKFRTENLLSIAGEAPEALRGLPAPTHAFIGGSGGHLREILQVLLTKNPNVRIVLNTITLESQAEALRCIGEFGFTEAETVTVNVSRAKPAGKYHLMLAQNPVTVFTLQVGTPHD